MKCIHCKSDMPAKSSESTAICPACGKYSAPEGFVLDAASGLYKITAQGSDSKTGEPISIVTWLDPATGKYAQDITPAEKQADAEAGPKPPPAKKKRPVSFFAVQLATVAVIALFAAGFHYFGYNIGQTFAFLQSQFVTQDVTALPQGADIPAFLPVEPTAPVMEASQELEAPEAGEDDAQAEDQAEERIPLQASRVNFYNVFANVNPFYTRAAQDQNYVWFLPAGDIHPFAQLTDLMYVDPDNPEPLPVPNLWPGESSVYSFVLFNDGVVVCAKRPDAEGYGFYLSDKAGIDEPELLFAKNEPAYMVVYREAVYALFPDAKQLVEFDPENGGRAKTISMPIESINGLFAEYLPEFSIVDGYIYYGLSYRNGQNIEYERRSLDTAEKISAFSPSTLGEIWTVNPVWDTDGNVYYGRYDFDAGTYSVKTAKPDGVVSEIARFRISRGIPPLLAGVGFKSLVAETGERTYSRKSFGTLEQEQEAIFSSRPYAATRDYLIADGGLYKLSDLGFISYTPAAI